jgi:hypothetical protein
MSADDAMRWLETLAAQQGANPDELITPPEERIAEPPAWVSTTPAPEPAAVAPISIATEPAVEAQSEMSEDDAMRWLESLAAQQGANPDELVTAPEDRLSAPPAWVAAMPTPVNAPTEPELAATPEPAPTPSADMSEDEAMRWLESLAAQQGADPNELITAPEDRLSAPPTWVAVTPPAAPVSAAAETPEVSEAANPPTTDETEVAKWLESRAPAPEPVATPPAPPSPPEDKPEPGGTTKLSRLAEQLAAKRRAKDEDIARRFEEQRAEKEAAMREVQERMEQKKRPGTGPLSARPGTGPLTRPGTGPMTRPGTGPILPTRPAPAPEKAPVTAEPAPRKRAVPGVTRIARPKKGRAGKSPYAAQPVVEIFALAQQRLSEGDFDTAGLALTYLVASNQLVDETITELETFLRIQPEAVGLWQVLGDAYMKNNRLQKALDAYRQALGQL